MRVSIKLAAQLLEALEAVGLSREELMSVVALDAATVSDPRGKIEWDTFAAINERAWSMLGEDAERMRDVGRAVARAPSYVVLQRLARTVVSVTSLYELATRWGASASLPHLSLEQSRVSERRLRFVGSIPEPHAPSLAFLHLFEGILLETPTLLGLARSTIVTSHVTPRTLDIVIELPSSPSIVGRLRRAVRNAVYAGDMLDLLEEQRSKMAEGLKEVQRSTAEVHEVLERLPDLVIIHRDGVLLWVNRAHVKTLGYATTNELVGRRLLDLVEPESRDLIRTRMRQPHSAEMPERSETRLLRRDGQVVVVEISPPQMVTFDGKPARLIVGRDVTERTRLQQQLQLADRMASIGMLAAGVAHEVNNPLGYVLNNIEIAIKALAPLGDSTLHSRNALVVALEGVDRIRTIVRDLLTLSRVDDAIIGPVDVLAVVESTLVLASKNISDHAVLSFEHQPVPLTRGTVARLGQVLLNLIANALESMPESSHDRNELRVVVRPSNTGGAIVEVSDNGVGIAPEHAPRVFEPFFTTKGPGVGTGLGLAITLRLVAEMGGLVSFESTPLRGTTFRVTLPPAESDEARPS